MSLFWGLGAVFRVESGIISWIWMLKENKLTKGLKVTLCLWPVASTMKEASSAGVGSQWAARRLQSWF